jgi:hypothetical protein
MMLEVGRAFAFTNGNQQHSPTETHETPMKILELKTENCQAVEVKEGVVNCHALRKRLECYAQAF